MKVALDVSYHTNQAAAACVLFHDWQDARPVKIVHAIVPEAARYQPGRFYLRELPGLLAALQEAGQFFDTILIDSFVHLRPGEGKGLGAHLYDALPYRAEVIGVAKSPLRVADRYVPVLRGQSKKPLYVSAIGCELGYAAGAVASMHGPYRIPSLLKIADEYSRRAWAQL